MQDTLPTHLPHCITPTQCKAADQSHLSKHHQTQWGHHQGPNQDNYSQGTAMVLLLPLKADCSRCCLHR